MAHSKAPKRDGARKGRQRGRTVQPDGSGNVFLFGRHAVDAALANPTRKAIRLFANQAQVGPLARAHPGLDIQEFTADVAKRLPPGAVHQNIVLEAEALDQPAIEALLGLEPPDLIIMLDQVTDPHNIGAIFRSAAAFGAGAIITQDRNSPPETGTLARAASGTLELVPWVSVTNLNRALETLAEHGYWNIGLDGAAVETLEVAAKGQANLCLVFGAEGPGLRQNVKAHCDSLAKLDIAGSVESLNVSNAVAVSLYIARSRGR